jgi:CheY-like chemotaxis protein
MAQECHLLITDIYMPCRDNLEIVAELRRIDPHLRILAISGGSAKPPNAQNRSQSENIESATPPKSLACRIVRKLV